MLGNDFDKKKNRKGNESGMLCFCKNVLDGVYL